MLPSDLEGDAMTISANVILFKDEFVAELNDGRRLEQSEIKSVALALYRAGVRAHRVHFEWRNGTCMITAGKQAALRAEINRLEREPRGLSVAA